MTDAETDHEPTTGELVERRQSFREDGGIVARDDQDGDPEGHFASYRCRVHEDFEPVEERSGREHIVHGPQPGEPEFLGSGGVTRDERTCVREDELGDVDSDVHSCGPGRLYDHSVQYARVLASRGADPQVQPGVFPADGDSDD